MELLTGLAYTDPPAAEETASLRAKVKKQLKGRHFDLSPFEHAAWRYYYRIRKIPHRHDTRVVLLHLTFF